MHRLVGENGKLPFTWTALEAAFHSRGASPEQTAIAYLQAYAVADYLFTRYRRYQVNALLDAIRESGDAEKAIRDVLHLTMVQLEKKVIAHVQVR